MACVPLAIPDFSFFSGERGQARIEEGGGVTNTYYCV